MLDAFALVALALDEPAAGEVEALIRRGTCSVSAVNLAEALDQLGRVHGHTQEALRAAFGPILGEAVVVLGVDEPTAWASAELRRRHHRRRHSELSLADCVALATAAAAGAIATADPPLAAAARAEGIDVIALPDSEGRVP
ncbi:MAG: PIN domain-containing protein [Solirubrobacteraceae bacterium]